MNMLNEPLHICFGRVNPEEIYRDMLAQNSSDRRRIFFAQHILGEQGQDRFFRNAEKLRKRYSIDEIAYIQGLAKERAQTAMSAGEEIEEGTSAFYLLPKFTNRILSIVNGEPLCDRSFIFQWRAMSLKLGQDIMTTAHCAFQDRDDKGKRDFFAWPTVIHVNDPIVNEVMGEGAAENHFHLTGSVPPFHMSWVVMMNHPSDIYRLEKEGWIKKEFDRAMTPSQSYRPNERKMSSVELIQLAFWLRAHLFNRIMGLAPISYHQTSEDTPKQGERISYRCLDEFEKTKCGRKTRFDHIAERMRRASGSSFLQSNGQRVCLDYAFPAYLHNEKNENCYRILVGERYLLYRCFYESFTGGFDEYEQDIFYLYLLIKSWFRNELIQVNQQMGFRNFSDYQNRKDAMWGHRPAYVAEGYRIAINGNLMDQMLSTQENRIIPGNTKKKMRQKVYMIDREVLFTADSYYQGQRYAFHERSSKWLAPGIFENEDAKNMRSFYTVHFPKTPDSIRKGATDWIPPRNIEVRSRSKKQALAVAQALTEYPYLRYRIRGMDGCSHEIGCRPETFATEFRFLRQLRAGSIVRKTVEREGELLPKLSATYHAGEDFLDIVDGLRAIDEALLFLEMERGERLGHALALGLEPEDYYRVKDYYVVTTKQNRLDDLVWTLCRSNELKVWIQTGLFHRLEKEAYILFNEIYGGSIPEAYRGSISLHDYFESWKLRGDHPDFFTAKERKKSKGYLEREMLGGYYSYKGQYALSMERQKDYISPKPCVRELMYLYHYDRNVRKNGMKRLEVDVQKLSGWPELVREIQDSMMKEIAEKGIYIECNPTSNYLISILDTYCEHPIFRFNERWKGVLDGNQLCVSINTDDMGVFDTSLENEYALIAAAMRETTNVQGIKYGDEDIKTYLNQIRVMGQRQTFNSIQGDKSVQQRYQRNMKLTMD